MLFLENQTLLDGSIEVKDLKVELLGEVSYCPFWTFFYLNSPSNFFLLKSYW